MLLPLMHRQPLASALLLSCCLHALLLSLPPGTLGGSPRIALGLEAKLGNAYTPLQVRLGLTAPLPPIRALEDKLRLQAPPAAAPQLTTAPDIVEKNTQRDSSDGASSSEGGKPDIGIPVPYYYPPAEVTQRPHVASPIDTSVVDDEEGSGKAILVLYINEQGKVDKVETESTHLSERLNALVAQQFGSARFLPAEKDGQPVKSRLRIEVTIRPRPPQATAAP